MKQLVELHETCTNLFYGQQTPSTQTDHICRPTVLPIHTVGYRQTSCLHTTEASAARIDSRQLRFSYRHKLSYYLATLQLSTSVKPNSEQHFKIKMPVSWYVAYCDTDRRFRGALPVKVCQSTRCS